MSGEGERANSCPLYWGGQCHCTLYRGSSQRIAGLFSARRLWCKNAGLPEGRSRPNKLFAQIDKFSPILGFGVRAAKGPRISVAGGEFVRELSRVPVCPVAYKSHRVSSVGFNRRTSRTCCRSAPPLHTLSHVTRGWLWQFPLGRDVRKGEEGRARGRDLFGHLSDAQLFRESAEQSAPIIDLV